jgi:hypothetical protein
VTSSEPFFTTLDDISGMLLSMEELLFSAISKRISLLEIASTPS